MFLEVKLFIEEITDQLEMVRMRAQKIAEDLLEEVRLFKVD